MKASQYHRWQGQGTAEEGEERKREEGQEGQFVGRRQTDSEALANWHGTSSLRV